MSHQADLLEQVAAELKRRDADVEIADAVKLSAKTIQRIRLGKGQPRYANVVALHRHLFPGKLKPVTSTPAEART